MELHFLRSKGIAAFQQEFAHGINITSEALEANRAFIVCEIFDSPAFDDDDKGIRPMLYVLAPKRTFFFSLCPEDCLPAKPMLKRGENMRLYKIIKKAMRIVSSCKRETILDTLRRHYLEFSEGYGEPGKMGYHQSMLNLFEEIKVQFMHARGANSALTINQDIDETRRSKAFCNFIMQADYPVAKKDLPNTFQVMTQQMINNNMYLDIVFLNDIVDFTPYTLVTLEILLEKSAYCFHLLDKNRLERLRACYEQAILPDVLLELLGELSQILSSGREDFGLSEFIAMSNQVDHYPAEDDPEMCKFCLENHQEIMDPVQ